LPRTPIPVANSVDIRKRDGFRRHTIANGWGSRTGAVHYKVISVIYPVLSSLMELRTLYTEILTEVTNRSSAGESTGPFERFKFGKVILEFRAERGYSSAVGWDIIAAFAEQLLQGQLPMTFMCHIAPPGSDVGIEVKLGVLI
ncbi:MAG: hypothetical protein Q9204_008637, partial [Flavoplaca sp. TL-2023a]